MQHGVDYCSLLFVAVDKLPLILGAYVEQTAIAAYALVVVVDISLRYLFYGYLLLLYSHHVAFPPIRLNL